MKKTDNVKGLRTIFEKWCAHEVYEKWNADPVCRIKSWEVVRVAYRVVYGSRHSQEKKARKEKRTGGKAGMFFLLFLLLVRLYWPAGTSVLRQLLLPGASETAFSSLKLLTQELWEGVPVPDAVEAYCRTVFQGAGLPYG